MSTGKRQPMTPAEFDANVRVLMSECPYLSETSGRRSPTRNARAGGLANSKHVLGMAQDFAAPTRRQLNAAQRKARSLGFWTEVHNVGTGIHLHVQGLPTGRVPAWWKAKYQRG